MEPKNHQLVKRVAALERINCLVPLVEFCHQPQRDYENPEVSKEAACCTMGMGCRKLELEVRP